MSGNRLGTLASASLVMVVLASITRCRARSIADHAVPTKAETTFVFKGGPSASFPSLPRPRGRGPLAADPAAPPCRAPSLPDLTVWRVDTAMPSRVGEPAIAVQLPREYVQFVPGTWWVGGQDSMPRESFAVTIGPYSGYPIMGVSPPPQQVEPNKAALNVARKD